MVGSGLLQELIIALIKGLPKRLRRHFVPAPDYALACIHSFADDNIDQSTALVDALSHKLFKMTGQSVSAEEWNAIELPKHLRMTFKVVDAQSVVIAQDKNLLSLQRQLQSRVQQTISTAATPKFERKGLTRWDFGDLPARFTRKTGQYEVQAYPGLQIAKSGVDVRLFDSPTQALDAHREGVNALVKLSITSPLKYLQQKLPNKSKLGLYFNPFGSINALIDDCVDAVIVQIVNIQFGGYDTIRQKEAFEKLCDYTRANINDQVFDIAVKVEKGLVIAAKIQKQLKGKVDLTMVAALGNVKAHLQTLVFPGFVSLLGTDKLDDWSRYLLALQKRLEKLNIDVNKDRLA